MGHRDGVAPEVGAWAQTNYQELFRIGAGLTPGGALEEDDSLLLAYSGPLLPQLNIAIVTRVPAEPAATIARAAAFFARYGQRFALSARDEVTRALRPAAEVAGMAFLFTEPGMLLAPLAGTLPDVRGLVIRRVANIAALQVYNDTMTAGFGGDAWAAPEFVRSGALLRAPGLAHYLGYLDGEPVATAMRCSSHHIAGVFNVCTVPAHRGRGIGAAITGRAAFDGRAEGCVASYLQASAMGRPVYARMGYREIARHTLWLSPG